MSAVTAIATAAGQTISKEEKERHGVTLRRRDSTPILEPMNPKNVRNCQLGVTHTNCFVCCANVPINNTSPQAAKANAIIKVRTRMEELRERLLQETARLNLSVSDVVKEFKTGAR